MSKSLVTSLVFGGVIAITCAVSAVIPPVVGILVIGVSALVIYIANVYGK